MIWVYKYLGKPWSRDGVGPDSYNCWNLVRAVHRERFGRELSDFEYEPGSGVSRKFASQDVEMEKLGNWVKVDSPIEGDAVLLGRAHRACHVGVWVGAAAPGPGYVLHSVQPSYSVKGGGVCAQTIASLKCHGWGFMEVYRHKDMVCIK